MVTSSKTIQIVFVLLQDCHEAEFHQTAKPCRGSDVYYFGVCYEISTTKATYVDAEKGCLPSITPDGGTHMKSLMWTTKRNHYIYVSETLRQRSGATELWVGLDSRNEAGNWISRWVKQRS